MSNNWSSARRAVVAAMSLSAVVVLVAGGCGRASGANGGSSASAGSSATRGAPPPANAENAESLAARMPLAVEPLKVNLGNHSPCDGPLKTTAKITNRTSAPVRILHTVVSCACTTGEIEGSMELGPNESRTLNVRIDLSGEGGKSQRVILAGASGPLGTFRVDYEIVPAVKPVNPTADLGPKDATATVRVVRTDGKPVKLLRLEPDIGVIKTAPDGSQMAVIALDRADAYVGSDASKTDGTIRRDDNDKWVSMYVSVVTDYPGCPNASVLLRRVR